MAMKVGGPMPEEFARTIETRLGERITELRVERMDLLTQIRVTVRGKDYVVIRRLDGADAFGELVDTICREVDAEKNIERAVRHFWSLRESFDETGD